MPATRLARVLPMCVLVAALQPMAAQADDPRSHVDGRLTYVELDPGELTVTAYDDAGAPGPVCLLSEYQFDGDGSALPVVAIANDVFNGASPSVSGISAFNGDFCADGLPEHLETVGDRAFKGANFTTLVLPDGVTDVGEEAFFHGHLESVSLNANVSVGDRAFRNNTIADLTGLESVDDLGEDSFADNLLDELSLSSTLQAIPTGAFRSNLLSAVTIPASVSAIGDNAFSNNPGLADVEFEGAAPTAAAFGIPERSFNNDPGPTMRYLPRFDASQVAGGFDNPWLGYLAAPRKTKPTFMKIKRPAKVKEKKKFSVTVPVKDGDHSIEGGRIKVVFKGKSGAKYKTVADGQARVTFRAPKVSKTKKFKIIVTYLADGGPYLNRKIEKSIKVTNS